MSCYDECYVPCRATCPSPVADSCNELPCVRQCPDSTTVIQPPPVVVTFPGPILSSCPQGSVVGLLGAPSTGSSAGSLSYVGSFGSGGLYNYGGLYSSGLSGLGTGDCCPYSRPLNTYHYGRCFPC